MIRQYALKITGVTEADLAGLRKAISPVRQARAERFRFEKDRVRCLLAEALLRYALYREWRLRDVSFGTGENDRPRLVSPAGMGIDFNLSHAGEWVVCALGDARVGVDVETVREREVTFAKSALTPAELEAWNALPPLEKAPAFYRLWTLKEACSKYDGLGLGMDFTTVAMTREDTGLWHVSGRDDVQLYCRNLDESTFLSVCVPAERATEAAKPIVLVALEEIQLFCQA